MGINSQAPYYFESVMKILDGPLGSNELEVEEVFQVVDEIAKRSLPFPNDAFVNKKRSADLGALLNSNQVPPGVDAAFVAQEPPRKKTFACFNCKKTGHLVRDCRKDCSRPQCRGKSSHLPKDCEQYKK